MPTYNNSSTEELLASAANYLIDEMASVLAELKEEVQSEDARDWSLIVDDLVRRVAEASRDFYN